MTNEKRREIADAFDQDIDPLTKYEDTFVNRELKPFDAALAELLSDDTPENTRRNYTVPIDQWKPFMERQGRHPACPSEQHVRGFVTALFDEHDNGNGTVRGKLRHLNRIFRFWINDPAFPHDDDFNPFQKTLNTEDLEYTGGKKPPRLPIPELQEQLSDIKHWRDRAIITSQLKLGLRAGELCNIKLSETNIQNQELQAHYEELGTHTRVADRPNSVFIPADREGNKSSVPRVLPLDDELRSILIEYLLVRPDNGKPWLLLSPTRHNQLGNSKVNEVWKKHFHPEYKFDDDAEHSDITSHFGRHRFSTWFKKENQWDEENVQYMLGHSDNADEGEWANSLEAYVHSYYEDIRDPYLQEIYKFGLGP